MSDYTIIDSAGNYARHIKCNPTMAAAQLQEGETLLEGWYDSDEYYFENEQPIAKGTAPTLFHLWDDTSKTWEEDKIKALTALKTAVDAIRTRLDSENITYNGTQFQTTSKSIENLLGKLQSIANAESLGIQLPTMFWIDASNNIITFATMTEFKLWLQGLQLAIDTRRNLVYYTARIHKDALAAIANDLTKTLNDLLSYNYTTGWDI